MPVSTNSNISDNFLAQLSEMEENHHLDTRRSSMNSKNSSHTKIDIDAAGDGANEQVNNNNNQHNQDPQVINQNSIPTGPNPETCDFITATQHGFTNRCVQLLESQQVSASVTDDEQICPLHWAAINNRTDLIKIFISYGAIIDQIGGELGGTPLHWAVRQCCFSACKTLLDNGADPTIMDNEGYTTLHIAAQIGSWPILTLLLSYSSGAHIDIKDIQGRTPIMMALMGRQMETTRVLCALGSKLNSQDKQLNSVLHHAVSSDFAGGINCILSFILKHSHGLYSISKSKTSYLFPPNTSLRKVHETMQMRNSQKMTPMSTSQQQRFVHCSRTLERFENLIPEEIVGKRSQNNKVRPQNNVIFKSIDSILFKLFGNFSNKFKDQFLYSRSFDAVTGSYGAQAFYSAQASYGAQVSYNLKKKIIWVKIDWEIFCRVKCLNSVLVIFALNFGRYFFKNQGTFYHGSLYLFYLPKISGIRH